MGTDGRSVDIHMYVPIEAAPAARDSPRHMTGWLPKLAVTNLVKGDR